MSITITPLDPALVLPAGALLARALAPAFEAEFPDPEERLTVCTLLYTANTRWSLDRGTVHAACLADGTLAGVLSLIPKPEPVWTDDLDAIYGYDLLSQWNDKLSAFDELEELAKAPLDAQTTPWTYINVLGVDPPLQGHGIGTALMQHALAAADRTARPMGLITDTVRNVAFYTRLGFATVHTPPATDSLCLWTMIRPAQSAHH
ncbi:MAG TPA: GNAT family N-acetyltransferase [Thermomicrobiales bacterium]|nr:GNAT family N-acetyltransferase [Thermomicrobiales bacterium]